MLVAGVISEGGYVQELGALDRGYLQGFSRKLLHVNIFLDGGIYGSERKKTLFAIR